MDKNMISQIWCLSFDGYISASDTTGKRYLIYKVN